jgi:DNA invertase Pin-like site-specific DNA recombinase
MRAAIYARVSTEDQDCTIQLERLREYVAAWKWESQEYVEKLSGKEGSKRPELERLLADVKAKKIDLVLVWKLDRFGRSTLDTLTNIKTLELHKVRFICPSMGIDTNDESPVGKFTLTIFAAVAELERAFIVERTQGGFRAYRAAFAAGKIEQYCEKRGRRSKSGHNLAIGRPRRIFDRDEAIKLQQQGWSIRDIAEKLKIGAGTAHRLLSNQRSKT